MTLIQKVERKLRAAIEAAIEEGWALDIGMLFPASGSCCAMGAVIRNVKDDAKARPVTTVRRRLGIKYHEYNDIARGFDHGIRDGEWSDLGARLRRDYYETTESP